MAGLKHATKKRFAKSTTTRRAIESGISAEFTEMRAKLERVTAAVKALSKQLDATAHVWATVASHQAAFAGALLAALPADGVVRGHAREVDATVRGLQQALRADDAPAAPHRRVGAVLGAYLRLVENVAAEYPAVETSYTEVVRYRKKVDKLSKAGGKRATVLQRNHEKLTAARAEHDAKLDAVLARMHPAYDKHEAVFQCAHHAFWLAQEHYSTVLCETTKEVRQESVAVRDHLINVDVNKSPRLPPIPRVHMLLPADTAAVSVAPVVEHVPTASAPQPLLPAAVPQPLTPAAVAQPPSPAAFPHTPVVLVPTAPPPQPKLQLPEPNHYTSVQYVSAPMPHGDSHAVPVYESVAPAAASQPVVHLTPETPAVKVSLPPNGEQVSPVKRVSTHGEVVYVPAVPSESGQPRSPWQKSTTEEAIYLPATPAERPQAPGSRQRSARGAEPALVGA